MEYNYKTYPQKGLKPRYFMEGSPCCNTDFDYIPTPSGEAPEYKCECCGRVFMESVNLIRQKSLQGLALDLQKAGSIEGMKRILLETYGVYYELNEEESEEKGE